jgi:hypothetical protein
MVRPCGGNDNDYDVLLIHSYLLTCSNIQGIFLTKKAEGGCRMASEGLKKGEAKKIGHHWWVGPTLKAGLHTFPGEHASRHISAGLSRSHPISGPGKAISSLQKAMF